MAATAVAAAGSLLAACAPTAPAANNPATAATGDAAAGTSPVAAGYANPDGIGIPVEPDATEEADVIVMGSGMAASLRPCSSKSKRPKL